MLAYKQTALLVCLRDLLWSVVNIVVVSREVMDSTLTGGSEEEGCVGGEER